MPATIASVAAKSAAGSSQTARRIVEHAPTIRSNVSDLERFLSLGLGGLLTSWGLTGRDTNLPVVALGGYLLYRGCTGNCPLFQSVGFTTDKSMNPHSVIGAGDGVRVEEAVTILKPAAEVYRFWRKFDNLPRFMDHLVEVKEVGAKKSHWVAKGPLGLTVEWDAEIVADTPNEMISWKSLDGSDVDTAGSVHFRQAANNRGTEVRVNLKYLPPAGKLGAAVARLFGEAPEQQVRADLRRFKQLMEAGEVPSVKGQPSGRT